MILKNGRGAWQPICLGLILGAIILGGILLLPFSSSAQLSSPPGASNSDGALPRQADYFHYTRSAGSGEGRGEELYYFKCWICHNQFQKVGPNLKTVLKGNSLPSGKPITEATLADKIREGGPIMPSFRYNLSDADVKDLVAFLRSDKCCWDAEHPPANPRYHNAPEPPLRTNGRNLKGGPHGVIRSAGGSELKGVRGGVAGTSVGVPLEGMMVRMQRENSNIATTVITDEDGRYEFPKLPQGKYELRIVRAMEFKPFKKDAIAIDGDTKIEDIELERITDAELLPPSHALEIQLSGVEWLWNISATAEERRAFIYGCGSGCHTFRQVFRNRFDEKGWRSIVTMMTHQTGSMLLQKAEPVRIPNEEQDTIVKWLARVRGPDSKLPALQVFPGPMGKATKMVVTEYELPRIMTAPHDPVGDSKGNIWINSHRTSQIYKLDPRTGLMTEYQVPSTEGANPGHHWLTVDKNDTVWFSENWSHKLGRLDPKTGEIKHVQFPHHGRALNSPGLGNLALSADGFIWYATNGAIRKFDPSTGQQLKEYPIHKVRGAYGNEISADGRYFAGGSWPEDFLIFLDTQTGEVLELQTRTPRAAPKRGGFDKDGNVWFGGHGGMLVKFDRKTRRLAEYRPPTPNVTFYDAMPDKNGEVWAGEMNAGRFLRFNPATSVWIEYVLPEPISHVRRTWIDNSTDPVTVWYVDHDGLLVRMEPTE